MHALATVIGPDGSGIFIYKIRLCGFLCGLNYRPALSERASMTRRTPAGRCL